MSQYHDCTLMACKGQRFDAANLTCNRCLRPFFFECMVNKKEVEYLISALNAYSPKNTTPTRFINKVKSVFGQESVFEFICPDCKSKGKYCEIVAQLKRDSQIECDQHLNIKTKEIENMYLSKLNELTANYNRLDQANAQLLAEKNELQKELSDLRTNYSHVEQLNAQLNQKVLDYEQNRMDGINDDANSAREIDTTQIMDRFNVLTHDIEARIKLECDKLLRAINNDSGNCSKKRKIGDNVSQNRMNISVGAMGSHHSQNVDLTNDGQGITTKLRAPNKIVNDTRDIYQVHVSEFVATTTVGDIENYVMENTGISNSGLFKVSKLLSKKKNFNENDEYATFKITTLHNDVYTKLSNPVIWEPDFHVRDFIPNRSNEAPQNHFKQNRNQQRNMPSRSTRPNNNYPNKSDQNHHHMKQNVGISSRHINTATKTPIRQTPRRQTPRKLFYDRAPQNEAPKQMHKQQQQFQMHQPYVYYVPASQVGQNFQTFASLAPMINPQQVYHQSQQQQQQHQMSGQQTQHQTMQNQQQAQQ